MNRKEKEQLLEALQEKERRNIKTDLIGFVKKYVHIEDRDSINIVSHFNLWQGQEDTLKQFKDNRLNIVLKARQLGITWLALSYVVWNIVTKEGFQAVALSKTELDAKELIRRVSFILKHIPSFIVDSNDVSARALRITIKKKDGEPSVFNAMSASKDSGRSFTANLVVLDEWAFQEWAREIFNAAYPTINRPNGGQVIGVSTAKRMTLFEEIWKKSVAGLNTFNRIFLSWRTDPRRDDEWYKKTVQDLGEHNTMVEYPSTPEEAFDVAEGSAFPEFSYDIHVCESFEIPSYWKRWRSCDNGYTDPFAWYWYAVDTDGNVHVYREFTRDTNEPKLTYSEQAQQVVKLSAGEEIGTTVLGHDAWAKQGQRFNIGKDLVDFYVDGGMTNNFVKAITDRRIGKATVTEYLKPYEDKNIGKVVARLVIHDCCHKLIETLPQLILDEKDCEKVAECPIDHWFDSLRYGLNYYHSTSVVPKEKPKNIVEEFFGKKPAKENSFAEEYRYDIGDDF